MPEKSAVKKGKGKACVNIPASFNPLDQTCIHPESYHVAQRYSTHKHINSSLAHFPKHVLAEMMILTPSHMGLVIIMKDCFDLYRYGIP